jgi:hypothetical protein
MSDERTRKPWRRGARKPSISPEQVYAKLQARRLHDLERCRLVWHEEHDPLAVCVALTRLDLPDWLIDAALYLLALDPATAKNLRAGWKRRRRSDVDAVRARAVAAMRVQELQPLTWAQAFELGELWAGTSYTGVPRVSASAAKKSYRRVSLGLHHDGRYFSAPSDFSGRVQLAFARTLERLKSLKEKGERGGGKK